MAKDKKQIADNLAVYNEVRQVETEALKKIGGGRLKGMSDINPMWRIKMLTKLFGICGIGWKYEITKQWTETYGKEVKGFTNINLYIKVDGEWSDAIPGTGGSAFVSNESGGVYVNDEVFKMSLTDAISVATKALGFAADIYYDKGARYDTKYDLNEQVAQGNIAPTQTEDVDTKAQYEQFVANTISAIKSISNIDALKAYKSQIAKYLGEARIKDALMSKWGELNNAA